MPWERLAGFTKRGKIWKANGIQQRDLKPLMRHMRTAKQGFEAGLPITVVLNRANRAERGNMTAQEFARHNGRLGGLARTLPQRMSYHPKPKRHHR